MRRTRLAYGALLLTALVLAGCAPTSSDSPPVVDEIPETVTDPEPVETEPAEPELSGPVIVDCGDHPARGVSVKTVQDGELVLWAEFVYQIPQQPAFACSGQLAYSVWQSHFVSMQFDDDYQRMAVEWTNESDDTNRVGWLTSDGQLVDVSELSSGSSFSSAAPNHFSPVFDPNTNEFSYLDMATNEQVWVDDDGAVVRTTPAGPENRAFIWLDGNVYEGDENPLVWGPCRTLPTPDGSAVFTGTRNGAPIVNLANEGFFAAFDNVIQFVPAQPASDGASCAESGTPVIPESDFEIENGVVSPDGTTLLFVAGRNEARFAFSVPVDGGQEPTQEFEMPRGAYGYDTVLSEWR